mmetsp:Transcript_9346/g.20250  ORF Transcript_9346/g.20250 Transcript_9346/m.20250 type:complete len:240 (+) Transcript_9346:110-829(+)
MMLGETTRVSARPVPLFDWAEEQHSLHLADQGELAPELLVDHESEDAHHGRAAVVELDAALGKLGLLVEGVPAEVDPAVAEVAHELVAGAGDVLHEVRLQESHEDEDLGEALLRNRVGPLDGRPAVAEGVEGVAGVVDVAREVDAGAGDDLAEEGKLGDTAVLELDVTKAVERLLVGVVEEAERIVESKRGLGAKLALESTELGRGLAGGGRGEGGSGGDGGGEDDGLHDWIGWGVRWD